MANSPSHKLGQIIGDVLEEAIEPFLRKFAEENGLYLDRKGMRLARRGLKLVWKDINGNDHALDFVLERGGSEEQLGSPVAFIESAWRSYTRHSRAKTQEIQGAVLPLASRFSQNAPFLGAILAGMFTPPSLQQLRSLGFKVLYIDYDVIVQSFLEGDIDISFNDKTPDDEFQAIVDEWYELSDDQHAAVIDDIASRNQVAIVEFLESLQRSVSRLITSVTIIALHGNTVELVSISEAISFLHDYQDSSTELPFVRFEIRINYSNRDYIEANFANRADAVEFLSRFKLDK